MKIGVDARPLSYQLTGIGVYLKNLLDELQRIDCRNHYVLISNGTIDYEIKSPRWRKVEGRLKKKLLSTLWMQVWAPIIASRFQIDLFWGPRHHLPLLLSPKIGTVLTVHDIVFRRYPGTMALPNLLVERLLMKRSLKRSDAVITDTHATADDIKGQFEVDPEKIFPIYLGSPKLPGKADRENGPGTDLPSRFFLFVGTLDPRKNLRRILEAFRLLGPARHDVHLLIVGGEGWKSKDFLEVLSSRQLSSYVHLSGYVAFDLLASYYEKAMCLVFPSLYEGFGLPILEAMSCGTPVITSNVSSMKEVAGDAALLIDPLDIQELTGAMKRVLTDESLRRRLSMKGLKRVNSFTWERCAQETLSVLNRCNKRQAL
ncbi:MAG: glycosyltransferase family 1 protein [Candidatus Desulfacyla sp.]